LNRFIDSSNGVGVVLYNSKADAIVSNTLALSFIRQIEDSTVKIVFSFYFFDGAVSIIPVNIFVLFY
jgi:hypothetical protein